MDFFLQFRHNVEILGRNALKNGQEMAELFLIGTFLIFEAKSRAWLNHRLRIDSFFGFILGYKLRIYIRKTMLCNFSIGTFIYKCKIIRIFYNPEH